MRRWKRNALLAGGGLFAAALGALALCLGLVGPCWSAWWSYGVWVDECPAGVIPYLSVSTSALGRGVKGQITVTAQGQLYDRQLRPIADWEGGVRPLTRFSPRVSIVAAPLEGAVAGTTPPETTLEPERGWDEQWEGTQSGSFFLPKELADGDWILRVTADVPSGSVSLDVPLPLYRPALEHILTDAPIYRPGQTVRARAALLDAGTLKPLESRPGRWRVYDPTGELLLDERGSTAGFGVAATTFPLAPDAPTGMWSIAFESGSSVERQSFDVREYRLPRFTVELTPSEPWYAEGASPVAKGRARYASGAPVQNAPVRVELRAADIAGWPPPNDWLAPQSLTTDADGGFEVRLPRVPEDLVGRPTVLVYATVTDQAGESAAGQAGLLLSEDAIAVDAVTELEGGLVADANNRLFVRVTTPDGRPLPEAKIHLRREWDARDPGLDGATDASAVARFQLDPGSPVTVTEPALPLRPAVPAEPVVISGATDAMAGGTDVRLAELGDRLAAAWRPCARLTDGSIAGSVWLRASSSGVSELWAEGLPTPITGCLRENARRAALYGPGPRLVRLSVTLTDPGSVHLTSSVEGFVGDSSEVEQAVADVAIRATACAAGFKEDASLPVAWAWALDRGSSRPRFARVTTRGLDPTEDGGDWEGNTSSTAALAGVAACVDRLLGSVVLDDPADDDAVGSVSFDVSVPSRASEGFTSPASWPGFSFVVEAAGVGSTVLRLPLGAAPDLRLRLSEVVAKAGDELALSAIRGPAFSGTLPDTMRLVQGDRLLVKFPFDPKTRSGKFVVPDQVEGNTVGGFASLEWGGARAVLYIEPAAALDVELRSPEAWKPGVEAELQLTTTNHGRGVPAGLTLAGVDSTMAAVAPLPLPDDWARVTVLAQSASPAFGTLDARALQTGQIAGANATQATVLRISSLPPSQPGSDSVSVSASGQPDVESPLAEAFYGLYATARKDVRSWEKSAPAGELMSPATMVRLWENALAAHPATDPFGRALHLSILPDDLRALVDPRVMVADAARLPEDVENWSLYVATEAP